jgi:hypothetical protein
MMKEPRLSRRDLDKILYDQYTQTYTYYVMSEGEMMGFNECPEDAFDDQSDKVYRLVSCYDVMLMHAGYGKRLDEVLRQFPEVIDPAIEDGYRVKAEVTVGWLRSVNVIAGLLQQELRVRNPEFRGMFNRVD